MADNFNGARSHGAYLRPSCMVAWRKGWENARQGVAFDCLAYERWDKYEQANYENGRLMVLTARSLGLDDVPAYRALSRRKLAPRRYINDDGTVHVETPLAFPPSIVAFLKRIHHRNAIAQAGVIIPRRTNHQPADESLSFSVTLPARGRRRGAA